jgi:hypothetical protein
MGVIIYAADDADFRRGDYIVMRGEITTPPTAPDITYILHCETFPASMAKEWLPYVAYRLVVVPRKGCKGIREGEGILLHRSVNVRKENHNQPINALFKWGNRSRVWKAFASTPMPLAEAFHRVNRVDDIETQRIISLARYQMDEKYARAALVYGTKHSSLQVQWPKKKAKEEEEVHGFRESDRYVHHILQHAPEVRNELREIGAIPSTIKKTKEPVIEWL